jgi:tetraacyldisaccharide 4'-kinase
LAAELCRFGLAVLSIPYEWGSCLRNRLYDRGLRPILHAEVPVVSIGNLTLGGTGKTPAVEWVARFYCASGIRPAILSRGYGASADGFNDEARMLRDNVPDVLHLQGVDRYLLAQQAVKQFGSQVLILDDGFQHRRLHRDLDIVTLDATNPWGYGRLFPRGMLREPVSSLSRADLIWLTRCDLIATEALRVLEDHIRQRFPKTSLVTSRHRPLNLVRYRSAHHAGTSESENVALKELNGRIVAAFCGIGNPEAFRKTLRGVGCEVVAFRRFPDHHRYSVGDLESLESWASHLPSDALIVTTQKDLVKLPFSELAHRPLLALRIGLEILSGREVLEQLLKGVML